MNLANSFTALKLNKNDIYVLINQIKTEAQVGLKCSEAIIVIFTGIQVFIVNMGKMNNFKRIIKVQEELF